MIYFIADTHFHHENVIKFCNRPFSTIEDMNQKLIDNWNQIVTDNDDVYILGDFLYRGNAKQANEILQSLKGRKFLIKGNHEHYLDSPDFDQNLFEWIKDYHTLHYQKRKFILFHYPILEWDSYFHNSIHLYGHVHNNRTDYFKQILGKRAINVGADMIDFTPISIEQILDLVKE
ncbi:MULTISPECIES: metallophosphoesterase [Streptococcus]|uniref:Calcineurin-like phosphoesterase family protein n=2 Tax=Streptococcus TaxID=1301 RepID=A0ABS2PT78_9STRE|nr:MULTISPECIES: metallophosphoesterase [Streptococcus]MBM7635912.1 calcineurin-like phosphoesterase family protein [Streptococcus saliviloxodontae]MBM7643248.1 calcineurin-like phosphoesterase family protein [Streptococcus loxodontisalivarius]